MSTKKITTIAAFTAIAFILGFVINFPLIPMVGFLKYDPKDVIIVISGFIFGPFTTIIMATICAVLEVLFKGGTIIDVLMDVISTSSFAFTAALIYKFLHNKKGAIISLMAGTVVGIIAMAIWNYIMTPIYFQIDRQIVVNMLIPGIIPFNFIKYALNSSLTLLLYKPIVNIYRHFNNVEENHISTSKTTILIAAFILISALLVFLIANNYL